MPILRGIVAAVGVVAIAIAVAASPAIVSPATASPVPLRPDGLASPVGLVDPAPVVSNYAHAGFDDPDRTRLMNVDLERVDGEMLLDIDWYAVTCAVTESTRTCTYRYRWAQDVVPDYAELSLPSATVRTGLTYQENRHSCSWARFPDGQLADETCTGSVRTTGSTQVDLGWVAEGEPTKESYYDAEGRRHEVQRVAGEASGAAFDEHFPADQSQLAQLAQLMIYPAG